MPELTASEDMNRKDRKALDELSVTVLTRVMSGFRDALVDHEGTINALNVFPVPDGDTGTNMRATLDGVLGALDEAGIENECDLPDALSAIGKGSLYGARGNSGIILSQFLRGLSEALRGTATCGPVQLARSIELASTAARTAVTDPIDGTMLSVAEGAAQSAVSAARGGSDLFAVANAAHKGSVDALWLTPTQLTVLADAGVVDAGGAGLTLFFAVIVRELGDGTAPVALELPQEVTKMLANAPSDALRAATKTLASRDDNYEVMFFLEATSESVARLRTVWTSIGDSVAIVGDEPLWNCHIHTSDIGRAIEAGIEVGHPSGIKVTDLNRQIVEEQWVMNSLERAPRTPQAPSLRPSNSKKRSRSAIVAIAHGGGLSSILYSLGAAAVMDGGQLMNPSTGAIVRALDEVDAKEVVLLPNSPDVVAVAREAAKLSSRTVVVLPTTDIQQAIVALSHFEADRTGAQNVAAMRAGIELVATGEVTRAIRDAKSTAGPIRAGDFLGISSSTIVAVGPTMCSTTEELIAKLVRPHHELATLYCGVGTTKSEINEIITTLAVRLPNISVEHHAGGQMQQLLVVLE